MIGTQGVGWVGRLQRVGFHEICRCQPGVGIRLTISRVPRGMERWMDVIRSNVLIRLVRVEERTHHWCMKLAAMKHVDSHSCLSSHHGCIQHRVKVPMHHRELNENHHRA